MQSRERPTGPGGRKQDARNDKLPTVRQTGSQSATSGTPVLLGGCGGLHSRVWCLPHSSVVGLCRVGEWASDTEGRGPGIAGWLIMVAESLIKVDERREGGDAKKEGSFPGGIYDVTLTGNWLKRLLAAVEVPCSQRVRVREGRSRQRSILLRTHRFGGGGVVGAGR